MNMKKITSIIILLSLALLTSACDNGATGKTQDAAGNPGQTNGAGTVAVTVPKDADETEEENPEQADSSPVPEQELSAETAVTDADVLNVGEKMFVGQMNDIYANTDDYLGRTIRYEGYFTYFENPETGDRYDMVVRNGPGCCGYDSLVGFEVDWDGTLPNNDDWCVVQGEVDVYEEDGWDYIIIRADELEVLPVRGNDTVTQ